MERGGFSEDMSEKDLDRNRSGNWWKRYPRELSDTWHAVFTQQFGKKERMDKWRLWRGRQVIEFLYKGGIN